MNGKERTETHEVVHVSQSSIAKGLMKAMIRRQEVLRVTKSTDMEPVIRYDAIKPNQMVRDAKSNLNSTDTNLAPEN